MATFTWSRQDSYYESTATKYVNTGSPGVHIDASLNLNLINNQRTYVFPTYNSLDGIQINHFATAGTNIDPTQATTDGTGNNSLTVSASTFNELDFCMSSNLALEGTTETSASLSSVVAAYSDGYKATSTLKLETFMAGALGAWKGYCIVNYQT